MNTFKYSMNILKNGMTIFLYINQGYFLIHKEHLKKNTMKVLKYTKNIQPLFVGHDDCGPFNLCR